MLVEIGHFALVLAMLVALVQGVVPLLGASVRSRALMDLAQSAALLQFGLVALAFAVFMHAHIISDFSVRNVFENSHTAKPMLYKVTGVWGSHEGSMMLWVFMLTLFGGLVAAFGRALPTSLRARTLAIQGLLGFGTLLFIIATSNPFDRLFPTPADGRDLNPLLQDPGLAFHPPFLYFGYVGFSITYSFAIAALIEGRVGAQWARWVRPWALSAWCGLTIGIAMGSWWAYYVLGWGGWWYWDPVENASFMPWLLGTALLHSAAVVEKRETLQRWTVSAGDPDLRDEPDRHLPGAVRCPDLGAFLRRRPDARRLYPGADRAGDRRRVAALCVPRARSGNRQPVRAGQPRGRPGAQQSAALRRGWRRFSSAPSIRSSPRYGAASN